MNSISIIYPIIVIAWWTLIILLLIPYRRIKAIKSREITPQDFSLGESTNVSSYVALANRNYMNLLEAPIIFYVVCSAMYLTNNVTKTAVILAWCYVALRAAHSLVHVTYNNVRHRLLFFATSNFVLIALLTSLTMSILNV